MSRTIDREPLTADALVRKYRTGIWRYLRFLGCTPTLADDLTQETFLAALEQPWTNVPPEALSAYLRTIARNRFFLQARRIEHGRTVYDLELLERTWIEFARDDEGDTFVEHLRDCLDGLEGRSQTAIDLFYRDRLGREAIAAKLSMTADGVKSLLRRIREVLRNCVERKAAPAG